MISKFINNDVVIHTPTLKDYYHVVGCVIGLGCRWACESDSIMEYFWHHNGEATCINIDNNIIYFLNYGYCCYIKGIILNVKEFNDIIKSINIFKELL